MKLVIQIWLRASRVNLTLSGRLRARRFNTSALIRAITSTEGIFIFIPHHMYIMLVLHTGVEVDPDVLKI